MMAHSVVDLVVVDMIVEVAVDTVVDVVDEVVVDKSWNVSQMKLRMHYNIVVSWEV